MNVPTVLQVFEALKANFAIGQIYMAEEFNANNTAEVHLAFADSWVKFPLHFEPHIELKLRFRTPSA